MTMSTKPANEARAEAFSDIGRVIEQKWKLLGGHPMGCSCELCAKVRKWISDHARLAAPPHPAAPADAGDAEAVVRAFQLVIAHTGHLPGASRELLEGLLENCKRCAVDGLAAARRLLDAPPGVGERMREALKKIARLHDSLQDNSLDEICAAQDIALEALAAPAPAEPERAKAGEWISVKERLPADLETVLVAAPEFREQVRLGFHLSSPGEWRVQGSNSAFVVTHWLPLPAAPAPAASSAAEGGKSNNP